MCKCYLAAEATSSVTVKVGCSNLRGLEGGGRQINPLLLIPFVTACCENAACVLLHEKIVVSVFLVVETMFDELPVDIVICEGTAEFGRFCNKTVHRAASPGHPVACCLSSSFSSGATFGILSCFFPFNLILDTFCPITVERRLSETSIIRNVKYPNPHFPRSTLKQRKISDYFTQ